MPVTLLHFLRHVLRPYKLVSGLCIFFSIAAGFWGPLNSLLLKYLIDLLPTLKNNEVSVLVLPACLLIINFVVFDNVTWRSINYIWAKYTPVLQNKIMAEMMDHTHSHCHGFYQDHLSGKLAKQITSLIDGVTRIITVTCANFLRCLSLIITSFITSYFVNPLFCLILVSWFILFFGFSLWMSKKLVSLSDSLANAESIVVGELVDSLSNHENVRLFSRKKYETIRMTPYFQKQQQAYTRTYLYSTLLACIQGGLIAVMMALCVFSLIYLYEKGSVSIGDFALILGLSKETGHMMWFTMSEVDDFNKAVGRCKQSLKTLMKPLEVLDTPNAKDLTCPHGKVTFDHVTFNYNKGETLFENTSIEIEAGQKVGLVGLSGSGKSTFAKLIMRLYDVASGSILIDGQNIKTVTQESLRENIALIPQDPTLFNRSLMENIRYGRVLATDAQVIEASKKAHAHDFISLLSTGYDSLVGERGVRLSGGQRQRIAIARAILKDAPILILDEATSQLDSITESFIQESLKSLMQNKTTIIIAHRLSTLLHMDRILVFDKGKVIEEGTHTHLILQGGHYKNLWDKQVGGFLMDHPTSL